MRRKMLRVKAATRRLLEEQIVVVAVLGSGKRSDSMWHVPHDIVFQHCQRKLGGTRAVVSSFAILFSNIVSPDYEVPELVVSSFATLFSNIVSAD